MIRVGRIVCALSVVVLAIGGCEEKVDQKTAEIVRPVKTLKVNDTAGYVGRVFSGRAKAANEVELSFRVAGTMLQMPVNVGDQVAESQLVARLDPDIYKAEADRLAALLESSKAGLTNAQLQLERQETLVKDGFASQATVDRLTAQRDRFKAEIAANTAALVKARLDLKYTELKSPFAGIVVSTYVEDFEDVRAKERVLRLVDPSRIEMVINIPESLISLAPTVGEVAVTFDAIPDVEVVATIKEIGAEASQTTRTYPITLTMAQPEGVSILPGMAGQARGKPREGDENAQKRVIVPAGALLRSDAGATAVWVVDESSMTVARREIRTGLLSDAGVRVEEGLSAGETIVIAGIRSLKEGQKVKFLEK